MALVASVVLWRIPALANETSLQPQTKCPVLDGKIDKTLFVEYDGKRIYVCCKGCLETIKKDPAKYISKLEAEGVTMEPIPPLTDTGTKKASKMTSPMMPESEHSNSSS